VNKPSNAEKEFDYSKPHVCLHCGVFFLGEGLLCKTCRKDKGKLKHRGYRIGNRVLYRIAHGQYAVFMSGENDMRNLGIGMVISALAVLIFIGVTCLLG
jgi:hypothetical protein